MSLVDELKSKTVFELKSYAKKNNINLEGVSTKNDILEIILNFVPKEGSKPKASKTAEEKEQPTDKVAVFSARNLSWNGVGTLNRGYSILTKEESEKWLTHKAVRTASPKEVATYYGK